MAQKDKLMLFRQHHSKVNPRREPRRIKLRERWKKAHPIPTKGSLPINQAAPREECGQKSSV
jgi:hypothetical protein